MVGSETTRGKVGLMPGAGSLTRYVPTGDGVAGVSPPPSSSTTTMSDAGAIVAVPDTTVMLSATVSVGSGDMFPRTGTMTDFDCCPVRNVIFCVTNPTVSVVV